MVSFADDFMYYSEVVRRFLDLHFSTFDGVTPTNGFHPMWMWILVGVAALFGQSFLPAVLVITAISIAGVYALSFWLLRRGGLSESSSILFAMVGTIVAATVEVGSMESVVAVPAMLALGIFCPKPSSIRHTFMALVGSTQFVGNFVSS
jgi:hypothetical protein